MKKKQIHELSRRERQVMEIIYRLGKATAAEVREELPDTPNYSAVRGILRVLETRGLLRHDQDGPRYLYMPTVSRSRAMKDALSGLLQTFFDNSTESAVAALLDLDSGNLTTEQREKILELIEQAKEEGR